LSTAENIRGSGDRPLVYEPVAVDEDGDPLTWRITKGPATVSIDPQTGRFVWRPSAEELGTEQVARIEVADPYGATAYQEIILKSNVTYVPGNAPPRIISMPPMEVHENEPYVYYIEAEELDGEKVTFSLEGDLAGLSESIVKITQLSDTS